MVALGRRKEAGLLRDKIMGRWRECSSPERDAMSAQLAVGLQDIGVGNGSLLLLIGEGSINLALISAAAHSLGATLHFASRIPADDPAVAAAPAPAFDCVAVEDPRLLEAVVRKYEGAKRRTRFVVLGGDARDGGQRSGVVEFNDLLQSGRQAAPRDSRDTARPTRSGNYVFELEGRGRAGCALSFDADDVAAASLVARRVLGCRKADDVLSTVPFSTVVGYTVVQAALESGACFNFAERDGSLLADIRDIEPSVIVGSSRLWSELFMHVRGRVAAAPWLHRAAMAWLDLGPRTFLKTVLAANPLRRQLGLARLRSAFSTERVPRRVRGFFRGLGIDLVELYDVPEAGGVVATAQPAVRGDRVLYPAPGVSIRLDAASSIVVRRSPPAGQAKEVASGDLGEAHDGAIRLAGEAGRLLRAPNIGLFSPEPIEARIVEASPLVRTATLIERGEDRLGVLLVLERDEATRWAQDSGVAFASFADLCRDRRLHEILRAAVSAVAADLSLPPMSTAVLPRDLDFEMREVTDTDRVWPQMLKAKALSEAVDVS